MPADVLVYNLELRRPGCVMLAAALGGNPSFAHEWPSDMWIVGGPGVDGLRAYGPSVDRALVRRLAQRDMEADDAH